MEKEMPANEAQGQFVAFFSELQRVIHQNAVSKGFWPKDIDTKAEKLLLMHAEISEVTEALRDGNRESRKIPGYTCEEEEMADLFIRGLDYAEARGLRLGGAVLAKITYNADRPHLHGKLF